MAKKNSTDVIEAFRQRQQKPRSHITGREVILGVLGLIGLLVMGYIAVTGGGPEMNALFELNTNTPTNTPSNTPLPTSTPTITPIPSNTPTPTEICYCATQLAASSPATSTPEPITATAENTATSVPTVTETVIPTETFTPTITFTPSLTPTSTASITPTPTPIYYTVKAGDTLGLVALKFGVTVQAIQELNGMGDSTLIVVGQVLQIPRP